MESARGIPHGWLERPCPIRAAQIEARARALACRAPPGSLMVEVGCYDGALARWMAQNGVRVYSVDHWRVPDPDSPYVRSGDGTARVGPARLERAKGIAYAHARDEPKMLVTQAESVKYAEAWRLSGDLADLVFIDADHSYEGVAEDVRAWWPVVRPGGWLSGHDWGLFGVTAAVTDWLSAVGMDVGRLEFGEDTTWFLQKPSSAAT